MDNNSDKQMKKRTVSILILLAGVIVIAILTFPFPDIDIKLLGIGRHRYFLFHSAILPLTAARIFRPLSRSGALRLLLLVLLMGFLTGVGIHLVTDIFQYKAVIFPFIGSLVDGTSADDRIWTAVNAILCFASAGTLGYRRFRQQSELDNYKHLH